MTKRRERRERRWRNRVARRDALLSTHAVSGMTLRHRYTAASQRRFFVGEYRPGLWRAERRGEI